MAQMTHQKAGGTVNNTVLTGWGLTCDGVVMVGSVGEGLQEVSLVLKGVVDLSFEVLEARDEVVESPFCIWMVQHAAGRDLQPAVAQVDGCGLTALHHYSCQGLSLQW